MVKGTSRQVIVVHGNEDKLFDQAIFILRDSAVGEGGISDEALLKEAKSYLDPPVIHRKKWLSSGPLWGAAGAGIAWLLGLIL